MNQQKLLFKTFIGFDLKLFHKLKLVACKYTKYTGSPSLVF